MNSIDCRRISLGAGAETATRPTEFAASWLAVDVRSLDLRVVVSFFALICSIGSSKPGSNRGSLGTLRRSLIRNYCRRRSPRLRGYAFHAGSFQTVGVAARPSGSECFASLSRGLQRVDIARSPRRLEQSQCENSCPSQVERQRSLRRHCAPTSRRPECSFVIEGSRRAAQGRMPVGRRRISLQPVPQARGRRIPAILHACPGWPQGKRSNRRFYSCRNASIGSSRAARRAGK